MNPAANKSAGARPALIVIGGSAGALDALCALLRDASPQLEVPVAVVLHLPSQRPSQLASVLARAAARPVEEAQDKTPAQPGRVYVAPPDYHLLIDAGPTLALSVDDPVNFSRPSIDVLFESAADVLGAGVLAVLLSGANDDGARGLAAVARAGGEVIVQDRAEAPSPAMPDAGLRAVPAARVLGARAIADRLAAFAGRGGAP